MQGNQIAVKTYSPSIFGFAVTTNPSRDNLFHRLKAATDMQKMGMVITRAGIQKIAELTEGMIQEGGFIGYVYLKNAQKAGLVCIAIGNRGHEEGANFIEIKHIIGNVGFKCSVGHIGHLLLQYIIKDSLFNKEWNYQNLTLSASAGTIAYFSHVFNFVEGAKLDYDWIMDESHKDIHESDLRVPPANSDNLRWEYNFIWGNPTREQIFSIGSDNKYPSYKEISAHVLRIRSFAATANKVDEAIIDSQFLTVETKRVNRETIEDAFKGLLVKRLISNSLGMFDNKDDGEYISELQCDKVSEIYETPCVFISTIIGKTQIIPKIWYDPVFFLNFGIFTECHRVIYNRAATTIYMLPKRRKYYRSGVAGETVIGMKSETQDVTHNVVIYNPLFVNTHLGVKVLAFFLGIILCQIPNKPVVVAIPQQFKRGRRGNAVDFPVEVAEALREMGIDQEQFNELRHIDYHFGDPIESYDDDVGRIAKVFEHIIEQIASIRTLPRAKFEALISAIQGICGFTFSDLTTFTALAYPPPE